MLRASIYLFILFTGAVYADYYEQQTDTTVRSSPNETLIDVTEITHKIIAAFNATGCKDISSLVAANRYDYLPALPLAVVAFCEKAPESAEVLFLRAEKLDPSNHMVYLLHAKHRWKINPESSIELWKKVVLYSRNTTIKLLAEDYLEGTAEGDEPIELEAPWGYFVSFMPIFGFDSNPYLVNDSIANTPSASILGLWEGGIQKPLSFGALNANYSGSYNHFTSARGANLFRNDYEVPLAIRVGTNEDIKIRPFGTYQMRGDIPFYSYFGLGVQGVAYRAKYRQAVQGSVFWDTYYILDFEPQAGTHFRFEYTWETYPEDWLIRFTASVEHVAAGSTNNIDVTKPGTGFINYSHNDISLQGLSELRLKRLILGLFVRINLREDDLDSQYVDTTHTLVPNYREDQTLIVQPSLTIPLSPEWQIFSFARMALAFSTFGASAAGLNENYTEWAVGVGIRYLMGNI